MLEVVLFREGLEKHLHRKGADEEEEIKYRPHQNPESECIIVFCCVGAVSSRDSKAGCNDCSKAGVKKAFFC
jgi:hypothetical protein